MTKGKKQSNDCEQRVDEAEGRFNTLAGINFYRSAATDAIRDCGQVGDCEGEAVRHSTRFRVLGPAELPAYRCQYGGNPCSLNCPFLPHFVISYIQVSPTHTFSHSTTSTNWHRRLTTRAMLGYPIIQTTCNHQQYGHCCGNPEYRTLSTVELEHKCILHMIQQLSVLLHRAFQNRTSEIPGS